MNKKQKFQEKKIVFTSNTSFSLFNFRLGLMQKLKEKGFKINCLALVDKYSESLEKNFSFFPLKNLDRKGKNPFKDFFLFWEYLRYYKKIKPNLVINYTIKPNIYSSLACAILKIPCISVITGLGYVFLKNNFLQKLVKSLYKIAFMSNNFVIIFNPDDLKIAKTFVKKTKIKLIKGGGVNSSHFNPNFCKEQKNQNELIFLFIGRFLKDKGIYELIEASKKLWQEGFNFQLRLLGDIDQGNPNSLQEKELEELKSFKYIEIFPFTNDVRPIICSSDCVVLPSYREGIPRSLLEAMAMEKPIITTDAPGCKETIIKEKNGFLVKPRDSTSLHQAMEKFINLTKKERENMGKEGRKLVLKKFDEKIIIKKYLDLIEKVLF